MPASSTVWLPSGIPASASRVQARAVSAVSSSGWAAWMLIQSGWYRLSIFVRAGVIRWGRTTGAFVPIRISSTCGNPPQVRQQPFELFVGQRQRIAAGKQHIPHLGMRRDVGDSPFPLLGVQAVVPLVADHPRPGAVPAIGRAVPRHQKQHAIRITVDDPRDGAVLILVERVVRLAAAAELLVDRRHDRPAQCLLGIPGIEEAGVVGGDGQRKRACLAAHRVALILRQTDHPSQRLHVADAVAELPVPILPFLEGGVRVKTFPEGPRPAVIQCNRPGCRPGRNRDGGVKGVQGRAEIMCVGLDRQCRSIYLEVPPPLQKASHFPSRSFLLYPKRQKERTTPLFSIGTLMSAAISVFCMRMSRYPHSHRF